MYLVVVDLAAKSGANQHTSFIPQRRKNAASVQAGIRFDIADHFCGIGLEGVNTRTATCAQAFGWQMDRSE